VAGEADGEPDADGEPEAAPDAAPDADGAGVGHGGRVKPGVSLGDSDADGDPPGATDALAVGVADGDELATADEAAAGEPVTAGDPLADGEPDAPALADGFADDDGAGVGVAQGISGARRPIDSVLIRMYSRPSGAVTSVALPDRPWSASTDSTSAVAGVPLAKWTSHSVPPV